ncbi:MAG: tetratricopeptide repeat protein [Bryobacteraceae bacterium]
MGPKDPKILDDLLLSINLDLRTKDFNQALATAQRVQAMHTATYTADSLPVADDFLRIGQIYRAEGKLQEAIHALITAYNLRMKLAGPLDPGLLPILDGFNEAARAIEGIGSESFYRQALMIRETIYGEDSTELISTLEWLADTYDSGGEFDHAEPVYERMLSLWETLVGKDNPMVAVKLDKLAAFYSKEGKPEKARAALERSVAIRARFLAVGLAHQAADAIIEGHREQARALYARALAALGPVSSANGDLIGQIRKLLTDIQKPAANPNRIQ